jgi:hypothetical protein
MAGGSTPRFDYSTSISQSGGCNESFLGVPHAPCEDDVYKGFFIPKGQFRFILPFCPSLIASSFGPNRIHGNSQRMVRLQLICFDLDLHLRVSGRSYTILRYIQIQRNSNPNDFSTGTGASETIRGSLWRLGWKEDLSRT